MYLTYDQFLTQIKHLKIVTDFVSWRYNEIKNAIGLCWIIGGYYGGSWGERKQSRDIESEPDFDELDNILENICPNITFLQYKRLLKSVIERDKKSDYGYYGESTEYAVKYIKLDKLHAWLVNENLC